MAVLSGPSLLFAPVLDLGNGSYKVICVRIPMPAPESVHTREQMHSTSAVTGVHAVCTWTDDCAVTRLLRSGAHLSHCPYHARVDTVGTRPPARTHARTHTRTRTHTHRWSTQHLTREYTKRRCCSPTSTALALWTLRPCASMSSILWQLLCLCATFLCPSRTVIDPSPGQ